MAVVMPPASVIPVHTVVQLASGVTRTMIMWWYVMWSTLVPFMIGAALGAVAGTKVFVSLCGRFRPTTAVTLRPWAP
jgi:hypothetical protein